MKATEFRLGNLIYTKKYNFDIEKYETHVTEFNSTLFILMINKNKIFEPIPLTEEWLLKFGFEKIDHIHKDNYFKKNWLCCESLSFDWRGGYIGRIGYVHQLQNLYFALTGEELTIK